MEQSLGVKVVYRNGQMEPVYEKEYTQEDYCSMLREDLLRLITDIEDMAYEANGGKRKDEWTDNTWEAFCKIKHKLLDKAGDIGRLPQNLTDYAPSKREEENDTMGSFVAKVFKRV